MIDFDQFELDNGLKVIVHKDSSTPIVAINVLYDVGARDEDPDRTGFAHLFEHLMFGGSKNISSYDEPLQQIGGDNNAFTTNDLTNYYLTLPLASIETGFWLESDRMLDLAFTDRSLEVQRQVVIEEFKQRYLNQPYGDVYLELRPMVYKRHPYQWPTIGKEIKHIQDATMDEVKAFYKKFYNPNNARLVIAGNVEVDQVKDLANRWFGPIEKGIGGERSLPMEPDQKEYRCMELNREVPQDALYMAFRVCGRRDLDYHATDLLTDVLSNGNSSRLFRSLIKENQLFSELSAYVTGDLDPGLLVISGKLLPGVQIKEAEQAVWEQLEDVKQGVVEEELDKVKNKVESVLEFSHTGVLNKALNLAIYDLINKAADINDDVGKYRATSIQDIHRVAERVFRRENCSVLHYLKNRN